MRPIKFRYWCKIEKKMYDKAYIEEHRNLAFMSELIEVAQQRYVFQQFTGLHDKNGTEVYEGDVLRLEFHQDVFVDYFDKEGRFVGKSTDLVQRRNWYPFFIHELLEMDYEVIGNIYENPELLEEGDNG